MLPTVLFVGVGSSEDEEEFFEAAPEGDPTGATVTFSAEVSTESGQMFDELGEGHCRAWAFR